MLHFPSKFDPFSLLCLFVPFYTFTKSERLIVVKSSQPRSPAFFGEERGCYHAKYKSVLKRCCILTQEYRCKSDPLPKHLVYNCLRKSVVSCQRRSGITPCDELVSIVV